MREQARDTLAFLGAIGLLILGALGYRAFRAGRRPAPETQNTYVGHYGFTISLTPETAARMQFYGAFTNQEKSSEAVFVFPRGMKPEEPFSVTEQRYKEYGIVRMEVNPNKNFPADADLLAAAQYAIDSTLKQKQEPYSIRDIGEPLPGFVIDITAPVPLRQVFLKGQKVHYLLTADPANPALAEVLDSLAEIRPHDEPGK